MYNVYTDCGVLVAENVTRDVALNWLVKGLTSDTHFSYVIRESKVMKGSDISG